MANGSLNTVGIVSSSLYLSGPGLVQVSVEGVGVGPEPVPSGA